MLEIKKKKKKIVTCLKGKSRLEVYFMNKLKKKFREIIA